MITEKHKTTLTGQSAMAGFAMGFFCSLLVAALHFQGPTALYMIVVLGIWKLAAAIFGSVWADNAGGIITFAAAICHGILLGVLLAAVGMVSTKFSSKLAGTISSLRLGNIRLGNGYRKATTTPTLPTLR